MEFRIWNKPKTALIYLTTVIVVTVLVMGAVLVFVPRKHKIKPSRFSSNQDDLAENRGSSILQAKSGENAEFVIEDGQSLGATARLLAERDFILSRYLFVAYAIFTGNEKQFKAGRYVLPPSVSVYNLVKLFSSGQPESDDVEITIPEGVNIADIDKIFAKVGLIERGGLLKPEIIKLEGYLFPDTYRFDGSQIGKFQIPNSKLQVNANDQNSKSKMVQEVIRKMRENFEVKTANLLSGLNEQKVKELIIVASMLEKEVQTEEDMRLVAGVIEKRLELGMPLEIDATVAYGVCYQEFLAGRDCDVSLANIVDNILVDSVYNTYKRKGLPISPISNPGLRAIQAALNPVASDYLFYLSAKDGTTIFSRTGAEHSKARQKYLK